jgi:acyl-coenzyme A synthetase/AMP-(fatty) acid ligase
VFLHPRSDAPALVDADHGVVHTHRELAAAVDRRRAVFAGRGLVFLFARTAVDTVVDHVAALHHGAPVALLDPTLRPEQARGLVARYRPEVVIDAPDGCADTDRTAVDARTRVLEGAARSPHPDLAVLLTTSGSTGSPKFVRLSRANVEANTRSIIASLGITAADRAITTLPLHYSFGMSVLNTHLAAGGSVVVTSATLLESRFWEVVREHRPTSFSGVPYTFHMLRRAGFETMDLPSVRMLTQAGGKLEPAMVTRFHELMTRRGGAFHVMYGQTEAAPRMTCLPTAALPAKLGSAGLPMSGGRIEVCDADGRPLPTGRTGHIVYTGPNVMMGYAEGPADLALGDVHGDRLETGDLGHLDEDGYLFVTGRTKRIGKVYGTRVSLDEVEQMLHGHGHGPVAVVAGPDTLVVHCEWPDESAFADQRRRLAHDLRVPISAIRFHRADPLPKTPNGKIDYRTLEARGKRSA